MRKAIHSNRGVLVWVVSDLSFGCVGCVYDGDKGSWEDDCKTIRMLANVDCNSEGAIFLDPKDKHVLNDYIGRAVAAKLGA